MSDDQEDIERIKQEKPKIATVLLHQLSSEMLTMKKEIEELQAEVKLNQLRHDDEMGDANANIISMKRQINALEESQEQLCARLATKLTKSEFIGNGKEEEQNMTDKEAAIKGLNKMLFGKEKE